jgi:hypothetical protein
MRGRISAAAAGSAVLGLLAGLPAASLGAQRNALTFTVVRANASATLTFHQTDAEGLSNDNGRVTLSVKKTAVGAGTLSVTGGGFVTVPIRRVISERVRLRRRPTETSPYIVTTCKQTTVRKTRGRLRLRRSGRKISVRWAFPQAQTQFCPGPKVGRSLTSSQTALYPASRFNSREVVLVVAGSHELDKTLLQATYRWRLTVLLERVG